MSRHRAGSSAGRRRAVRGSRHRAPVRPRYGRIVTLTAALAVSVVAAVGGAGLLPSSAGDPDPAAAIDRSSENRQVDEGRVGTRSADERTTPRVRTKVADDKDGGSGGSGEGKRGDTETPAGSADTALPPDSGEGRRIVFSQSRQRVWLVDGGVQRTYLVSGSVYDNLHPGTFEVYSKSEEAVGIDDSGTMRYFVRFTTGDQGAAIGFHDIPVDDGKPVQTVADLGTPLSHGCIRQKPADAIALWEFAPIGTTVVVTA